MKYSLLVLTISLAVSACGKGSDSGSPSSNTNQSKTEEKIDENTETPPVDGTGQLALMDLAVTPVAAQGSFLTATQTSNELPELSPGSLAIALGLQKPVQKANLISGGSSNTRTPVLPSYSIASGAPEELIVYVKKIVLSKEATKSSSSSEITGPVSLKEPHLARFADLSESAKQALSGLVGKSYPSAEELAGAIAQASGLGVQSVSEKFSDINHELSVDAVAGTTPKNTRAVLFEDPNGKAVKIADGAADLSELVTTASGAEAQFKVAEGTYNTIKIEFANKAKVKGCLKMLYKCPMGATHCSNASTADIPGSSDVTDPSGAIMKTYCTQTAKSPFDVTTQNSDFENKTPEMMDFPLALPSSDWLSDEPISTEFPLGQELELKAADTTAKKITLLVDLNRMLRYYNRGRQDQGPNPSSYKDRAYFFTSVFKDSIYAFVGKPGRIYGYEMQTQACLTTTAQSQGAWNSGTGRCGDGSEPRGRVPLWMTLITSPTGAPLTMLTTPDDDNDLTITKGDIRSFTQCPDDPANPKKWVEPNANTSPQTATLRFGLCEIAGDGSSSMGSNGEFRNFPADLEGVAPLAPDQPLGSGNITGVTLYSTPRNEGTGPAPIYEGPVTVARRL